MKKAVCTLGDVLFAAKKREPPKEIHKILFFKIGALGDVIMTTPLVRAIRCAFPDAIIDYACGKSFSCALLGNRNINYLIEFDERIFYKSNISEIEKLRRRIRENMYDIIFVLDRHWAVGAFLAFTGSFRIGFERNGEGFANNLNIIYRQNKHDILSYLDLGIYLKVKPQGIAPEITIDVRDRKFAEEKCTPNTIAIAPGGGTNTGQKARIKLWPKINYLSAVNELSKKHKIVLLGGKGDRMICEWIYRHAKNKKRIKNLCGRTTIQQAGAIMERCKLVICNDSGIMHIASCVTDNIISLFGATDPKVLAPLNKESTFIWKEKTACYDIYGNFDGCEKGLMKKISVEDVLNAAKRYRK
jgi:lipopolysaccharide heptosyltransferase II